MSLHEWRVTVIVIFLFLIFHFQGNGPTTGSAVFYGPKTICKTSKKTSTKKLIPEVASAVKLEKEVICKLSFTEEEDKAVLNTTRICQGSQIILKNLNRILANILYHLNLRHW